MFRCVYIFLCLALSYTFCTYLSVLFCCHICVLISQEGGWHREIMGKTCTFLLIALSFHSRCRRVSLCCDCPVTGRRCCFTVTSQTSSWPRESPPWKSFTVLPSTGWRNAPLAWLIWYAMVKGWIVNRSTGRDVLIPGLDCVTVTILILSNF